MGVYSISVYGTGTYGFLSPTQFAAGFTVEPKDHDSLFLTWGLPGGTWSDLMLVRSSYGFPTSTTDGVVLLDEPAASAPTSLVDDGLRPGRFYYYTLFVYATSDARWVPAAMAMGLVVVDHGFGQQMWDWLPNIYRVADLDYRGAFEDGPLRRFLGLLGYQFDRVRSEIDTLLRVADIDRVSGALLPVLADSLGVGYEPELGMRVSRNLVKNAVHLSKTKGTVVGIEGVASAYTSFGAEAVVGKNLLLDVNHSGWTEGGLGHWEAVANCSLDTFTDAEHDSAALGSGSLRIIGDGNGDATVISGTLGDITLVPVSPSTQYTVSAYVKHLGTARTVNVSVTFYEADGTPLATTDGAAAADTDSWVRRTVTATSGATARWAAIGAVVTGPADTEEHLLSAVQLEAGGSATDWEPARAVHVYFTPQRTNLVPNPSFEVDTSGWTAGASTSTARVTTHAVNGDASLSLTRTGTAGTASATTSTGASGITVTAGDTYTASAHLMPNTTARTVRVSIAWFTEAGAAVSTSTGTGMVEEGGAWVRPTVTAVAPPSAARAAILVEALSAAINEVHRVDSVLLEQTEFTKDYFDASFFPPSDYLWAGTAHASASHAYQRRTLKDSRLVDVLPQYIPAGTTVVTHYGEAVPASAI